MGKAFEIEFPEEGRIGIWGQNEAGKSTFLQSIEYALYGPKPGASAGSKREDVITWGKNDAEVEIQFSISSTRYKINRRLGQKGSPRAEMVQLNGNKEDSNSKITAIKGILTKVEELTGMDRDMFGKLIYIGQKDLDALKDLQKSNREQLLNRVIGIEAFDDANKRLRADLNSIKESLDTKNNELKFLKRNKKQYESDSKHVKDLRNDIRQLRGKEKPIIKELVDIRQNLEVQDWLARRIWLKDEISDLEDRSEKLNRYETNNRILNQESESQEKLLEAKEVVQEISFQKAEAIKQKMELEERQVSFNLTDQEITLLEGIRPKKKRTIYLSFLFLSLGISITLLALLSIFFFALGLPLLALGIYQMRSFLRLDRLESSSADVQLTLKQLENVGNTEDGLSRKTADAKERYGVGSVEEVLVGIERINSILRKETGQESIAGLKAVTMQLGRELNDADLSDPEATVRLDTSLKEAMDSLARHESKFPDFRDLAYDPIEHESLRKKSGEKSEELSQVNNELLVKNNTIEVIQGRLQTLRDDFDRYPIIQAEKSELEYKERVTNRTLTELLETSRSIRSKVLPQAAFIINNILPDMTDGRYADFEIGEDLKFKVHSLDAGGYKEREIFSGGTQDQFLVALRLAFTQSILDSRVHADSYCLFMDECISSSDDSRKRGVFDVLETMRETFSQIFIVAHEDVSNHVDNHLVLGRDYDGHTVIRSKSW